MGLCLGKHWPIPHPVREFARFVSLAHIVPLRPLPARSLAGQLLPPIMYGQMRSLMSDKWATLGSVLAHYALSSS